MSPADRGRTTPRKPPTSRRSRATAATSARGGSGRSRVSDVTQRIERRQRTSWRRRFLIGLGVVVALGLVAGGIWVVGFSQALAVTNVKVSGTTSLTPEAVTRAAAVPMGTPMVRLDLKPISERVAALPQVAKVDVVRSWPNTVEIKLTERVPVFVVRQGEQQQWLVDAGGLAYLAVADVPKGMMVAEVADHTDAKLLADVAVVVAALTPELRISVVKAQTRDSITLAMGDGRTVVWGGAADSPLKAKVATQLLAAVQASVYDVSAPGRPVTR